VLRSGLVPVQLIEIGGVNVKKKVLLADRARIFAEGVRALIERRLEVAGIVSDGRALVKAGRALKPDLVVADVVMPLLNGIEALRQLRQERACSKVIFLTMADDTPTITEALRAGAAGYLLKTSPPSELEIAITRVLRGGTYITPLLSPIIKQGSRHLFEKHRHPLGSLTTREREVLQLIAEGRTSKEIAAILDISIKTVEFHRTNIANHLGIHSIAQLTRYAIEHGILPS
jgi:DNA-binding NarL/FixJ family response regulator